MRYKSIICAAILMCLAGPGAALDLGRSGIALNPPARGWKLEEHRDAAIAVWHLRAESWDPPPASGLIAVTVSMLDGDPWPDPGALRDAAGRAMRAGLIRDLAADAPFDLAAGRFQIAGEDFTGAIGLGDAPARPAMARVLAIRTGDGALLISAFSIKGPGEGAFDGLFGPGGILTAMGPGAEALNGAAAAPATAPPAADPALEELLQQMQGGFSTGDQ
ncbi:hypothetical protein [Rhodobacter xanthinilyticus]|nr:hypothetical protein [Rhodobacter xanthinilyticus]